MVYVLEVFKVTFSITLIGMLYNNLKLVFALHKHISDFWIEGKEYKLLIKSSYSSETSTETYNAKLFFLKKYNRQIIARESAQIHALFQTPHCFQMLRFFIHSITTIKKSKSYTSRLHKQKLLFCLV